MSKTTLANDATTAGDSSHNSRRGPLVVLGGWLGCRPSSLERYVRLYQNDLGFSTALVAIATPAMIIDALFGNDDEKMITSLAWKVLYDIHQSQCHSFVFHAFSNNGYILWSYIHHIILFSSAAALATERSRHEMAVASYARHRFAGVVFDSCPADRIDKLPQAMEYASWPERLDALRYLVARGSSSNIILAEILFEPAMGVTSSSSSSSSRRGNRALLLQKGQDAIDKMIDQMQYSCTYYPQLFLYSTNDALADSDRIDAIIQHRADRAMILYKKWETSQHCRHFQCHPKEYQQILQTFYRQCQQLFPGSDRRRHSRL